MNVNEPVCRIVNKNRRADLIAYLLYHVTGTSKYCITFIKPKGLLGIIEFLFNFLILFIKNWKQKVIL